MLIKTLRRITFVFLWQTCLSNSAQVVPFDREMDIIYHKQDGFALTLDKVSPKKNLNQAAVIFIESGAWGSSHHSLEPHRSDKLPDKGYPGYRKLAPLLLERGYTLFYVIHGSQPRFTIREIRKHINAAVDHIRHHARKDGIQPDRLGVMGYSSAGHLALLQVTRSKKDEQTSTEQPVPNSPIQAGVAFWAPTDFMNYGAKDVFFHEVVREWHQKGQNLFIPSLDDYEPDADTGRLTKVTDPIRLAQHYRNISPYYHVTRKTAPTLILHGESDNIVPLQQAKRIVAKFQEAGVPTQLSVKEGAGHIWEMSDEEMTLVTHWFDRYLLR